MTSFKTASPADPEGDADIRYRPPRPAPLAGALEGVSNLVAACRNGAALAMMSERDLDDLGLLPWEVRSEDWRKESAAAPCPLAA